MKITKSQFKKVIQEEIEGALAEQTPKKAGFFKRAFKSKSKDVEKMIRNVGDALDRLERQGGSPDPEYLEAAHIETDKFGADVDSGWYGKMSKATGDPDQRKRVGALRVRASEFADGMDKKAAAYATQKREEEEADRSAGAAKEKADAAAKARGPKEAAEAAYKECQKRVQDGIRSKKYGTQGGPNIRSEADEARERCSEQYKMAMKNVRESQNKEGKTKITKSQLKKVIQEEMEEILAEA